MTLRCSIYLYIVVLATSSATALGATTSKDYLFRELTFSSSANNQHFQATISNFDTHNYELANKESDRLIAGLDSNNKLEAITLARVLTNAAIIKTHLEQLEPALNALNKAIDLVDSKSPFHEDIYHLMMIKARVLVQQEELVLATDLLRRAQHITHRNEGVYNERQTELVYAIAEISTTLNDHLEADRQQLFNLRIGEKINGANSVKLIPRLMKAGDHFKRRGRAMRIANTNVPTGGPILTGDERSEAFLKSLGHYHRALKIQEDAYGENDLRLVDTLRSIAQARITQQSGRRHAEEALIRVVEIIASSPVADTLEHAVALVELGDVYTINGKNAAKKFYLEAWQLLSQAAESDDLQNQVFDSVTRIFPTTQPIKILERRPSKAGEDEEIYADATYSVDSNGKVYAIKIVEGNVSADRKRLLRNWLRNSRYRPRIINGVLSGAEGLSLRQNYIAPKQEPAVSAEEKEEKEEKEQNSV